MRPAGGGQLKLATGSDNAFHRNAILSEDESTSSSLTVTASETEHQCAHNENIAGLAGFSRYGSVAGVA